MEEERIKYINLYKELSSIYNDYDKCLEDINELLSSLDKGMRINNKVAEEENLKNVSSELTNSKNNLYNLLKNIEIN